MISLILIALAINFYAFLFSFLSFNGTYILALFKGEIDRKAIIVADDENKPLWIVLLFLFIILLALSTTGFISFISAQYLALFLAWFGIVIFQTMVYYFGTIKNKFRSDKGFRIVFGILSLFSVLFLGLIFGAIIQSKTIKNDQGFFSQISHLTNAFSIFFGIFLMATSSFLGSFKLFKTLKEGKILKINQNLLINGGFVFACFVFLLFISSLNLSYIFPKILSNPSSILCLFSTMPLLAIFAVSVNSGKYKMGNTCILLAGFAMFLTFIYAKFPGIIINKSYNLSFYDFMTNDSKVYGLYIGLLICLSFILPFLVNQGLVKFKQGFD